jgi:hypothetical protein
MCTDDSLLAKNKGKMDVDDFIQHVRQKSDQLIALQKEVDNLVMVIFELIKMHNDNALASINKNDIIKLQIFLDETITKFRDNKWAINLENLRK